MRLSELGVGDTARIHSVNSPNASTLKIMTMGLLEPTKIKVLSKTNSSMEINFENVTMAISLDIAEHYGCVKLN